MGKRDPRVDAYIAKAPEFAKPILAHIRDVVHDACPGVEEDLKWSTPSFIQRASCAGWPRSSSTRHSVSGSTIW